VRSTKASIAATKSRSGFTLIEVIVFIVIGGVVLPAILTPFINSLRESEKPEIVTTAAYLAQKKMEEFTKFDYDKTPELDTVSLTAYASAGITGYEWRWEISYVDSDFNSSGSNVGYKKILVRVKGPDNDEWDVESVVTRFPLT
jgi:prepilin-type N-terminal cleavage/methylation domain-containing protein